MKLDTLTIENFKSISRLQIDFNGCNAVISGQNGAGKTSVLDAVCWLITNKMSNGKAGESANILNPDNVTVVEAVFDTGLKLRRECNDKSIYFINNVPTNATGFKYDLAEIFKAAVPTLLLPFNFCNLHYNERRGLLLKLFPPKIEIDTAEFVNIAGDLQRLTPEQIIKAASNDKKKFEKEVATIPARIDELSKNLVPVDINSAKATVDALTQQLQSKTAQIKKLESAGRDKASVDNQISQMQVQIFQAASRLEDLRRRYKNNATEINQLRKQYDDTAKALTGTCPTCGGKVPAKNRETIESKLSLIGVKGKDIAEQQKRIQKAATDAKTTLEKLRGQLSALQQQAAGLIDNTAVANLEAATRERDELQDKLSQAKVTLANAQNAAAYQKRIEQLKQQEFDFGSKISNCDKKIFLAESYIRRKIELLEQSINQHFQFVQFRMFEQFKVSEGIKECCEPLLNGVPYAALSKGEKLKASLDILQALQKAYGIELPVFIDDAESYTSNSFVDLPNQVILLKAVDGVPELKIEISGTSSASNEGRKTA